jgi:hypothetical protein
VDIRLFPIPLPHFTWSVKHQHLAHLVVSTPPSFSPFNMVINPPSGSYTSFQTPIIPEDGAQSSEDGSGLHSPVFATDNYPAHTDNCSFRVFRHLFLTDPPTKVRYSQDHLDIQHSTGMITPQYDYGHNLSAQQPPMLDTSLELPNSGARIPFSPHYSIQSRNHMNFDPSPIPSRITAGVPPMDYRYSPPSERRFQGRTLSSYTRPTEHSYTIHRQPRPKQHYPY